VRNSIYSTGELASVYACFLLKSLLRISKRIRSIQTLEKGQNNWGEGKFEKKGTRVCDRLFYRCDNWVKNLKNFPKQTRAFAT